MRSAPYILSLLVFTGACKSAEEYRAEADSEVYGLIRERRLQLAQEGEFRIDPPENSLRRRILEGRETPRVLGLLELLEISAENSREYQGRKESVYLTALDLTLEQWRLSWQKSAGLDTTLSGSGDEAESLSAEPSFELTRVLGQGAVIGVGLGWNLFKTLVDSAANGWQSTVDVLDVRQPLLAGYGELVTLEPLTQAERNLVYEVRSFERFRRTFAVDVAQSMYRLVQQVDTVSNEERNVANLTLLRVRNEALAEAGRLSEIEVDQARQDELRARDRRLRAQERLDEQYDNLKVLLGLPVEWPFEVDPAELEELLVDERLPEVDVEEELATRQALENRLDYLTLEDQAIDAARRVEVSLDALQAGLDLTLAVGDWRSESGKPLRFNAQDLEWSLGAVLDLPLDKLPERNVYRTALIGLEASVRSVQALGDNITADLRGALRELARTRQSHTIQQNSVDLANRRIESTRLNLEAGRATTRDLLEAQQDLVNAENATIAALIDYTLARLSLYLDLELIRVDASGLTIAEFNSEEPVTP